MIPCFNLTYEIKYGQCWVCRTGACKSLITLLFMRCVAIVAIELLGIWILWAVSAQLDSFISILCGSENESFQWTRSWGISDFSLSLHERCFLTFSSSPLSYYLITISFKRFNNNGITWHTNDLEWRNQKAMLVYQVHSECVASGAYNFNSSDKSRALFEKCKVGGWWIVIHLSLSKVTGNAFVTR